jgi:hypothetical protein
LNSKQIAFAAIFIAIILGSIVAAGFFTDWFGQGQDQGLPDQYQQISFE